MNRLVLLTTLALSAVGWSNGSLAQSVVSLKRDPFARLNAAAKSLASQLTKAPPHASLSGEETALSPERQPVIRAIIAGGTNPIVYADERIMKVGETMHGYQLKVIREQDAVFVFRGKQVTLGLDERKNP